MKKKNYITEINLLIEKYIKNEGLKRISKELLNNKDFKYFPGSIDKHHSHCGGLIEHTYEVMVNAILIAKNYNYIDIEAIVTAALWHDFGKTRQYIYNENTGNFIKDTIYCKQIYHVVDSYRIFRQEAEKCEEVSWYLAEKIGHCILAHHGRPEYNAVKEPNTPEAYIVHTADMLSAVHGLTVNAMKDGVEV